MFQDSLKSFNKTLRQTFGQNVLNFSYRLLNVSKLNIKGNNKIKQLFKLSEDISWSKRKELVDKVVDYIRRYDPNFSWKILREIETRAITDKEERVMPPLQISLDEVREEGMQKGLQTGRQAERKQVILKMFQKNADISFIAEVTGLSKAEIKKLKDNDLKYLKEDIDKIKKALKIK